MELASIHIFHFIGLKFVANSKLLFVLTSSIHEMFSSFESIQFHSFSPESITVALNHFHFTSFDYS